MKAIILSLTLFFSQAAFSELVTVRVPVTDGASTVVVKAIGVEVDMCNSHALFVNEAFGALDGFRIAVVSTAKACALSATKQIDLEAEAEMVVVKESAGFTFDTREIKNIKIEYK